MSLELRYAKVHSGEKTGAPEHVFRLEEFATVLVGSLTSNQIALGSPGVEPIHCMIEKQEGGSYRITDLGTLAGVKVNGTKVEVEHELKAGDVIDIGATRLTVSAPRTPTVKSERPARKPSGLGALPSRMLFDPKHPTSKGRMLEVVAYWGNTVLNVDQFHHELKGFEQVTIGDPTKAHFISGGREFFESSVLADVEEGGCVLRLADYMRAHVRKDGELKKIKSDSGIKKLKLGPRDYAHIEYGPVRYFLHYAHQPQVELPRVTMRDAFFVALSTMMAFIYVVLVALAVTIEPKTQVIEYETHDGPILTLPEDPDKRIKKPIEIQKPEVKLTEVTIEPPKPQKPKKPEQVKPVKPTKAEPKPPAKKAPTPPKPEVTKPMPQLVTPAVKPTSDVKPVAASDARPPSLVPSVKPSTDMPSIKPSIKPSLTSLNPAPAGDKRPGKPGNAGGPGMNNPSAPAPAKGKMSFDNPGSVDGKINAPSFTNLSKLGVGGGKVSKLTGAGALSVDFQNSAGGAGMKGGSAANGKNLGGIGDGSTLAIPGNGNMKGWGNGPGGLIGQSGGNGPGGTGFDLANAIGGGKGPGGGLGHSRANVELPALPTATGGSMTPDEILKVIRSNLNQIRHCYEQLLQRSPKAAGKLTTQFTINAQGRVASVSIAQDTVGDPVMRGCVSGKIQRWKFREAAGRNPVNVTYPFVFNPI